MTKFPDAVAKVQADQQHEIRTHAEELAELRKRMEALHSRLAQLEGGISGVRGMPHPKGKTEG